MLVLLAVLLAGSVGFSAYRLISLNIRVAQEVADTRWLLGQLEVEYHRFRGAAAEFILGAPGLTRDELLLRYDILWSRFPALLEGDESAPLRAVEGFGETIAATFEAYRGLEPAVRALRYDDPRQHRVFLAQLAPVGENIRSVVLDALAFNRWAVDYRSGVLGRPQGEFFLSVGVFVLVAMLLFGLLWREVRRSSREVVQRQRTEARLREALEAAEKASRTKTNFLANVSHELRTPLNAILGFTQILGAGTFGAVSGRNREYLDDIHLSAEHLHKLVDEILDLARVEVGTVELYETPVAVDRTLRTCRELTLPSARERGMEIRIEHDGPLPTVVADETKLRQVVINLLNNAIKYSNAADTIVLRADRLADGGLAIAVTDHGPGIPSDALEHVFEPFNRVSRHTYVRESGQTGAGLGLAIAKSFVEMHGGEMRIDSRVGEGTTVTATLPPARLHPMPAEGTSEAASSVGADAPQVR